MLPLGAIRATTLHAADLLDEGKNLGAIEIGKFTDLVAVESDPFQDTKTLQRVRFVIKQGVAVKQE